jgi:glutamate formiminotransferase
VVNISEGRDLSWLSQLAGSVHTLADLHTDASHHRSVLTLIGSGEALVDAVISIGRAVVSHVDLVTHEGVHPRIGALDVVPFVPLGSATMADAVHARDQTATRLVDELSLPVYLYGPLPDGSSRSLPEVRRAAAAGQLADLIPAHPSPGAGAVALGARRALVAWNLWLTDVDLARAMQLASSVRSETVRALGLEVEGAVQISCNLLEPTKTTPADVADQVAALLDGEGSIARAELVGLVPRAVIDEVPANRWRELDLSEDKTIETACERLAVDVG